MIAAEQEYEDAIRDQLLNFGDYADGARVAIDDFVDYNRDSAQRAYEEWTNAFRSIGRGLTDLLMGREADIGRLFQSIGANFLENRINQGLSSLLGSFSGGKASGGPVMGGTWAIVGERGPEPVYFPQDGIVFPNDYLDEFRSMKAAPDFTNEINQVTNLDNRQISNIENTVNNQDNRVLESIFDNRRFETNETISNDTINHVLNRFAGENKTYNTTSSNDSSTKITFSNNKIEIHQNNGQTTSNIYGDKRGFSDRQILKELKRALQEV